MKFAILGTGIMGRGWITQCAMTGHDVCCHDSSADALAPEMDAKSTGEEAVAHHVLEDVAPPHARQLRAPCHQVLPAGDVSGGVVDDRRVSGGAGGGMQPNDLIARDRQEPVGKPLEQVPLGRQRQTANVAQGGNGGQTAARE